MKIKTFIKKNYKVLKNKYKKSKPQRVKFVKRARRIEKNINNYFKPSNQFRGLDGY